MKRKVTLKNEKFWKQIENIEPFQKGPAMIRRSTRKSLRRFRKVHPGLPRRALPQLLELIDSIYFAGVMAGQASVLEE
jgi:hypothetical protein